MHCTLKRDPLLTHDPVPSRFRVSWSYVAMRHLSEFGLCLQAVSAYLALWQDLLL